MIAELLDDDADLDEPTIGVCYELDAQINHRGPPSGQPRVIVKRPTEPPRSGVRAATMPLPEDPVLVSRLLPSVGLPDLDLDEPF